MKILNKILSTILIALVAIMIAVVTYHVTVKIVAEPSDWTDEFLRYSIIWLTMLGAPYAYGAGKHLSINILTNSFSPRGKLIDKLVVEVLVLLLSVVVFVIGGVMVTVNAIGQYSASMHLPMQLYYVGVPIGGCLMVVYCIDHILGLAKELKEGK